MNRKSALEQAVFSRDEDIRYGMGWSLIAHFILAFIILAKGILFPGKPLRYIPTLKVDLVGLPDALKNEVVRPHQSHSQSNQEIKKILQQAEADANRIKNSKPIQVPVLPAKPAHPVTPAAPAFKDEMLVHPHPLKNSHEVARKNKRALERIKSLAKIQEASSSDPNPPQPSLPIKGNKVSPGSSLSGEARESAEANYLEILRDRLQDNWTLPPWIARQSFAAQVQVFIDSRGKLHGYKFVKSSGNAQFDEAVKRAIAQSQPFPFPPHELLTSLLNNGILVGFPL